MLQATKLKVVNRFWYWSWNVAFWWPDDGQNDRNLLPLWNNKTLC